MTTTTTAKPMSTKEALNRWPRLTAHMICESLGYFTPEAAARALLMHKRGQPNWCEWYIHMTGYSANDQKLVQVGRETIGRAVKHRKSHTGYMAHYPNARALVEHVRKGGQGPMFASWF